MEVSPDWAVTNKMIEKPAFPVAVVVKPLTSLQIMNPSIQKLILIQFYEAYRLFM